MGTFSRAHAAHFVRTTLTFISLALSVTFAAATASAVTPLEISHPERFKATHVERFIKTLGLGFNRTYRVGDEWGKIRVTQADIAEGSDPYYRRMALATAHVGGATGFFLGKFNGHYVMATNHHVCEDAGMCMGETVEFPLLNLAFQVTDFYGSWPEIDLALFEITVGYEEDAAQLMAVASPFNFGAQVYRGQELATLGFGIADNSARALVGNRDSDCIVFSGDGEYRQMADPDDLNPGPYKAWSFANGCDVSHGDSGSAMMDRRTGEVVGIIWTGRIPKNAIVQSSAYLRELLASPDESVWKELSYSVPAPKMREHLNDLISRDGVNRKHVPTLMELLQ